MKNSLFCVRFFKDLPDSTGHSHHCVQGVVEAVAADESSAIEAARLRFAEEKGVDHWTARADYEVVECISDARSA
jgi:hypothetical protein